MVDFNWDWSGEVDLELGDNPVADWAEGLIEEYAEEEIDELRQEFYDWLGIGPDQFGGQATPSPYIDPHMTAAAKGQLLYIKHLGSKKAIGLFPEITSLQNSLQVNWNAQPVYGRPDPIATYQNTGRTITIGFKLTAANILEAKYNWERTLGQGGENRSSLSNMMYPTYHQIQNYRTIASPPLMAIKHVQLIQSFGNAGEGDGYLCGYITQCNMIPKFDHGAYENSSLYGNLIYPKTIDITITFNVLHDYTLGWEAATGKLAELFPEIGSGEDIGKLIGDKLAGKYLPEDMEWLGELGGGIIGDLFDELLDDEDGYEAGAALSDLTEVGDALLDKAKDWFD